MAKLNYQRSITRAKHRNVVDINYYKPIFLWDVVMENLLGEIVADKTSCEMIRAGPIHSTSFPFFALVFLNVFSVYVVER